MMFGLPMGDIKNNRNRPKRTGGSKARHAGQNNNVIKPYQGVLKRAARAVNLMDKATLQLVEDRASFVLENLGVGFGKDDKVIALLTGAGAKFQDGRIYFPKGMCQKLLKNAPQTFTHHARNPKYSVEVGGQTSVFTLMSGAQFVRDLDGERRPSILNDLINFLKLAHLSPSLHSTGFMPCQASDIVPNERYLDALYAHIKMSDKPFSGAVGSSLEALHSIEMAEIVFGDAFLADHQVLLAELSVQSPLKFDQNTLDVLQVYASSNQATVISSMALLGVTCPMSVFGALVQITAEFLAGAACAQIINPGSPVVFGVFSAVASMQSGMLSFSSAEGAQFIQCAGQMARKLGVPFRASGGVTSSKTMDSQAAFEGQNGINTSISAGANIISNVVGSLEGGATASYQKFLVDSDQLVSLQKHASRLELVDLDGIDDVISDGINAGSFMGSLDTKAIFGQVDVGLDLSDNNIFEQWRADGEKTSHDRATETCKAWLENYQQPLLDQNIDKALRVFIEASRTVSHQTLKTRFDGFPEADCQAIAANHLHDNMWGDVFRRFER